MRAIYKILIGLLLVLAALIIGWYVGKTSGWGVHKQQESSTIVLEQMRRVVKLITVEGYVTEVLTHNDYNTYFVPLLSKKALVKAQAKVSVGYDFEKIGIDIDSTRGTIKIINWPAPEILSIDHDFSYYDISEGLFNKFTEADHNQIQAKAKEYLRTKALEGPLMQEAEAQKEEIIQMLTLMIQSMGYNLETEDIHTAKDIR